MKSIIPDMLKQYKAGIINDEELGNMLKLLIQKAIIDSSDKNNIESDLSKYIGTISKPNKAVLSDAIHSLMEMQPNASKVAREANVPRNTVIRIWSGEASVENIRLGTAEALFGYYLKLKGWC